MQVFNGIEYLKIDIANHYGLDKKLWDERLAWVDEHEANLEDFLEEAEEPALYYVSVKAYREVQAGNAIGFPIALDATCSGCQILSCLIRDVKAAKLCNVISTGKRENMYKHILNKMCEYTEAGNKAEYADVKKSIMTSLYGSEAKPKEIFGEELLNVFQEVMSNEMPKVWNLNKYFLSIWDKKATKYSWILPDNFHVNVKVFDKKTEKFRFFDKNYDIISKVEKATDKGRCLSANSVHSIDGYFVREISRRCMYSPAKMKKVQEILKSDGEPKNSRGTKMVKTLWDLYKKTGMLSIRICDYINTGNKHLVDAQVVLDLINTLPKKPFELITIHDSFRCLPNYGNDIRQQYVNMLAELAKSNMLNHILTSITGKEHKITLGNKDMYKDVLNAEYALS